MAGTNEKSMVTDLTPGSVFSNLVRLALYAVKFAWYGR